jgi:hypothetical protein
MELPLLLTRIHDMSMATIVGRNDYKKAAVTKLLYNTTLRVK